MPLTVHHLVGHWGFLGCAASRNPTRPENRQWPPQAARSLRHYGERASRAACSRPATPRPGTQPKGHAGAQFVLGLTYAKGSGGLPQDEREAARLFKLASDQGLAQAKDRLSYIEVGLRQEEEEQAGQSTAPEGLILCDLE